MPEPSIRDVSLIAEEKPADELSGRVAELEKALKKMQDKETAAKKKAASAPTAVPSGRMFLDSYFFNQDDASHLVYGNVENVIQFRTARLAIKGDAFDVVSYQIELDFAGSATVFKDTFISLRELPYAGSMTAGHFKEPISLEELTSDNYITFMERSVMGALVPARNLGVMLADCTEDERMTWAVGTFVNVRDDPPRMIDDNGATSIAARATWLPWYDEATEGRGLLHLGLGARYQDADTTVRFNTRPEVGAFNTVGPRLLPSGFSGIVDTGNFNSTGYSSLTPEIAMVYGPLSVQAEYTGAFADALGPGSDPDFDGYYVQASYFLTGEHRRYRRTTGLFDRIKPFENFFRVRTCDNTIVTGKGAWEVAYRYSWIDLNDPLANVFGGRAWDHTFGVNWYWNPYTRVMFNYIAVTSDVGVDFAPVRTTADILETRFQIDF